MVGVGMGQSIYIVSVNHKQERKARMGAKHSK